jgi:hypothetical protein
MLAAVFLFVTKVFSKLVLTLDILLSKPKIIFVFHNLKIKKMTTQEVAKRYYELIQQHKYKQIQEELYAPNAISIEPENDTNLPLEVEGIAALQQKEGLFFSQVEEMFGGKMSEPIVSNFHFAQMTEMDVRMKGKERKIKGQIGIFEVRNGKIVKEQFFYDDFA